MYDRGGSVAPVFGSSMRDGPPTTATTASYFRSSSPLRALSPLRNTLSIYSSSSRSSSPLPAASSSSAGASALSGAAPPVGEYSSTSSLLQEITGLRTRLRELEDDSKSSVITSLSSPRHDEKDSAMLSLMKKDMAQLEQEKALQEQDFLNQMSLLQVDHQKQLSEWKEKVKKKDELNHIINDKLRKYVTERDDLTSKLALSSEQLAASRQESLAELDACEEQLRVARQELELVRSKGDTEEKYLRLLEDARESHLKEMEQMKFNLAASDVDIADSRNEIDHLQMELDELQTYREALLQEVTVVRLELSEEKRVVQSLDTELTEWKLQVEKLQLVVQEKDLLLGQKSDEVSRLHKISSGNPGAKKMQTEMKQLDKTIFQQRREIDNLKDTAEDLQSQKDALTAVVIDLKQQLQKSYASKPLSIDTAPSTDDDEEERAITSAEQFKLNTEMQGLESRLVRFHSKLADKECQIDELNAALKQERQTNKQMRTEMKQLHASSNSASLRQRSSRRIAAESGVDGAELAAIQKENKSLKNELDLLRAKDLYSQQQQPDNAQSAYQSRSTAANCQPRIPACATPSRTTNRMSLAAPRTPVSGLVASFERRIGTHSSGHVYPKTVEDQHDSSSSSSSEKFDSEKEILDLQNQLRTCKQTIAELQEDLSSAKNGQCTDPEITAHQKETEEHVERLTRQVEALEAELDDALTTVEELRSELTDAQLKRDGADSTARKHSLELSEHELARVKIQLADQVSEKNLKLKELEDMIDGLHHANLDLATKVPFEAQKKFDEEHNRLTNELATYQSQLSELDMDHAAKVEDMEHQIATLGLELEDERKEKESLQKFLATSTAAAIDKPDMDKKLNNEITKLSHALTCVQMSKANLERENVEKLKMLEREVEALELEAEAELNLKCDEIEALKNKLTEKEEEITRLENERTQLCTSMNDVSFSRKDDMDELQSELLDTTNRMKAQARELQTLKLKIDDHESRKLEASSTLQRRIVELEGTISDMKDAAANRDDVSQLKEENAVLRETIRDVKIERRQLKERVDSLSNDKSASRSSQVLRDRNNVLKDEVEKLNKRLKKMEASITRFAI